MLLSRGVALSGAPFTGPTWLGIDSKSANIEYTLSFATLSKARHSASTGAETRPTNSGSCILGLSGAQHLSPIQLLCGGHGGSCEAKSLSRSEGSDF